MKYIINKIEEGSKIYPHRKALVFKDESIDYEGLYKKIKIAVSRLHENGVSIKDNVCLITSTSIETVILYFAIQECGATAILMDKKSKEETILNVYEEYNVSLLVSKKKVESKDIKQKLFDELIETDSEYVNNNFVQHNPDDIAEIIFTSGTTSKAKGVMLSYKALSTMLDNTSEGVHLSDNPVLLAPLPMHHMFFMSKLRRLLFAGGTIVLQDGMSFGIVTENNIKNNNCNELALVPSYFEILKNQFGDRLSEVLSNIRRIDFSSGMLSINQRKELSSLFPNTQMISIWGTSETGGILFVDVNEVSKDEKKIASIGKNYASTKVRIIDDNDVETKGDINNPGRISIKTDAIMSGYWNNDELNKKTIIDGWITINDIVYKDENGYFYLLGRSDDIINVGGEKVSPVEIENIVEQSGMAKECACIGVDDKKGLLGQVPVIFICPNDKYDEIKLKSFLAEKLEKYKQPKKFIVIDKLPRNSLNKVDKNTLKKITISS